MVRWSPGQVPYHPGPEGAYPVRHGAGGIGCSRRRHGDDLSLSPGTPILYNDPVDRSILFPCAVGGAQSPWIRTLNSRLVDASERNGRTHLHRGHGTGIAKDRGSVPPEVVPNLSVRERRLPCYYVESAVRVCRLWFAWRAGASDLCQHAPKLLDTIDSIVHTAILGPAPIAHQHGAHANLFGWVQIAGVGLHQHARLRLDP